MGGWSVFFVHKVLEETAVFQRSLIEKENLEFGEFWSDRGALTYVLLDY